MSRGPSQKNSHLNHLLGTDTDQVIAQKMGLSLPSVAKRRKELNIPAYGPAKYWTPEVIAMLGKKTDADIAKIICKNKMVVLKKRHELGIPPFREQKAWTEDEIKLLGTDSDKLIAQQIGRTEASVRGARIAQNIKPKLQPESWPAIKQLPQGDLFAAMQKLHDPSKPKLTHKHLAEITGYSLSRMQKWMTPGTAQEPLSISTRHHIYLAITNNHQI